MSKKSLLGIAISAAVSGAIAGGAVALYGVTAYSRTSFSLSQVQAAVLATGLAFLALALVVTVVRWMPDQRDSQTFEDTVLAIVGSIATLSLVAVCFPMMKLATSIHQLWLLPAIVCAVVAALLSVLPLGMGLLQIGEWVPAQAPSKGRQ